MESKSDVSVKELWSRLLKIAGIERARIVDTGMPVFSYSYHAIVSDCLGLHDMPLRYIDQNGNLGTHIITSKKLELEQLIEHCMNMKKGISICVTAWIDEYGIRKLENVTVMPCASSIEEVNIWADMHETAAYDKQES